MWAVNSLSTTKVLPWAPWQELAAQAFPQPPVMASPSLLQKGSPQYQLLTVPEHSPHGTLVGNVTGAVDADEGPNAIVYYFIAGRAS